LLLCLISLMRISIDFHENEMKRRKKPCLRNDACWSQISSHQSLQFQLVSYEYLLWLHLINTKAQKFICPAHALLSYMFLLVIQIQPFSLNHDYLFVDLAFCFFFSNEALRILLIWEHQSQCMHEQNLFSLSNVWAWKEFLRVA